MDNQCIINPLSLHAILNFSFFFVTFRLGKISFRFVWFRFVSFRFYFVMHFTGTLVSPLTIKDKTNISLTFKMLHLQQFFIIYHTARYSIIVCYTLQYNCMQYFCHFLLLYFVLLFFRHYLKLTDLRILENTRFWTRT